MIPASPKTTIGFAILLTLALGAPRFAQAAAASATPSTKTLQQRIDALLKYRLKPEPLPVNPPNPFQMTGGAKREAGAGPEDAAVKPATQEEIAAAATAVGESAAKELAGNASEVLITCASRLKLGGVIILKDQIQIVVNGVPRKEGDTVAADWNNTIVYLKIAKLLPGQLVLRYGEAEATLKF